MNQNNRAANWELRVSAAAEGLHRSLQRRDRPMKALFKTNNKQQTHKQNAVTGSQSIERRGSFSAGGSRRTERCKQLALALALKKRQLVQLLEQQIESETAGN